MNSTRSILAIAVSPISAHARFFQHTIQNYRNDVSLQQLLGLHAVLSSLAEARRANICQRLILIGRNLTLILVNLM
jgi:hypothetical protein